MVRRNTILKALLEGAAEVGRQSDPKSHDKEERQLRVLPTREHGFTYEDFKWIVDWKTDDRFGEYFAKKNGEARIRRVTREAFLARTPTLSFTMLLSEGKFEGLFGVKNAIASALLTFHDPRTFTVVDPRALAALREVNSVGQLKLDVPTGKADELEAEEYLRYVQACQQLRRRLKLLSLRNTDRALYTLGGCTWTISTFVRVHS